MLPPEMGCGSGVPSWRRLRDWQIAGVWDRLHRRLLNRLAACGRVDWSRASLDSAVVSAKKEPPLDAIPPVQGPWGRPRRRPTKLHADKGYDFPGLAQPLSASDGPLRTPC
jgi:hypothetical protein